MLDTKDQLFKNSTFPSIERSGLSTLQVNLGYLCNQQCLHCHVNAGPKRTEIMSRDIMDSIIDYLINNEVQVLDITGGAPEMNPDFRYFISRARPYVDKIINRCNLTILTQPGYEDYIHFFVQHQLEIVSSLPCYSKENVDKQRGKGVFDNSIHAIRLLNEAGYGRDPKLVLNFVYNPGGDFLPPEQVSLEQDYKKILNHEFGIVFNHLFTITNMPINRFGSMLLSQNRFESYMALLKSAFNPDSLASLMCRSMISIDWQGNLYDCDFNQLLGMKITRPDGNAITIDDLLSGEVHLPAIQVANHCYGCTAGQGSSCGGALA